MNTIKKISFPNDFRCFKAGWSMEPKPGLNLLVGDQGCGKSTLLELLGNNHRHIADYTLENHELVETFFLDTEKNNPRGLSDLSDTHLPAAVAIGSRWKSHGETILQLVLTSSQAKDSILFVDEPEAGLSVRSQFKVLNALQKAQKQGCQIFVATHSQILIEAVDSVFSLEHNAWMTPQDFIQTQKYPPQRPSKRYK